MSYLDKWKKIKKEKKLTISDIAELSGLPKGSVQNIFAGYVPNPRIDTVRAIEKALGISDGWTDEERAQGVVDAVKITVTVEEIEWLEMRSEIIRVKGEKFFETLSFMLEAIVEENPEKN